MIALKQVFFVTWLLDHLEKYTLLYNAAWITSVYLEVMIYTK